MPYTNCGACGAKALVGATRCPRCQAPFVSYDVQGKRVPTVNCPSCGVQRPVAIGVCPNCLTSSGPARARVARSLTFVGLAIIVIIAVGYLMSRRLGPTASAPLAVATADSSADSMPGLTASGDAPRPTVAAPEPAATSPEPAMPVVTSPPPSVPASTPAVVRTPVPVERAVVKQTPAPPPSVTVPDTGRWDAAVANTWVRLRSAPTRESAMLRMIDSAQHVRLGPPLNGWRSARVGVDRGWVDPRLFTVIPAPRP